MDGAKAAPSEGVERDPLHAARAWLTEGVPVALATVVSTWGSSPVPVGGQLAVAGDGRFQGSVSGGCIENDVIAEASDVMASGRAATLEFGVSDETAWRAGLPCGGRIRVLVEKLDGRQGLEFVERILAARARREPLLVRTRLKDGHREVFAAGDALPREVAASLQERRSGLLADPEGEVFLHALIPPVRIVIVGATHTAQILCEIARVVGYDALIIDPRTAYTSESRFAGVEVYEEWPKDAIARIGLDASTALVVLAHESRLDDEALSIALRSSCLYIGALGSSRNHARRTERLKAAGFTDAEIARIRAPIGLDIGARSPQEIALSIMAEIVLAVRGPRRS